MKFTIASLDQSGVQNGFQITLYNSTTSDNYKYNEMNA